MPEPDTPLSIRFSPSTRARMKEISAALAYSESNFVNLCVEAIIEIAWAGENARIPQIVKLLRAGMEDSIRSARTAEQFEPATARIFEVAEAEGASEELKKALQKFVSVAQSERQKTSYSTASDKTVRRRRRQ